ncbi:hypothetical protein GGR20_003635 [Devosia subaequoris]|uniref:Uncharacterized protein n=1 Tax=Devosia subaequoris TaxID=395930 RepID=A0A7W6NCS7_9HYPH|nr:hypothetical protein [Devosia subaequoris]
MSSRPSLSVSETVPYGAIVSLVSPHAKFPTCFRVDLDVRTALKNVDAVENEW